jgi:hypothetical protein
MKPNRIKTKKSMHILELKNHLDSDTWQTKPKLEVLPLKIGKDVHTYFQTPIGQTRSRGLKTEDFYPRLFILRICLARV